MSSMLTSPPSYALDSVNVSLLTPGKKGAASTMVTPPLVITPRWETSLSFLTEFLQRNRPWLEERMNVHGAILIRGFDVANARDMQTAVQSFHPKLNNTYRGTSPRNLLDQTEYVFSAAEVPTNYPIAQHIEMSFLPEPPSQLYFGCLKPSASVGGETSLADFRSVFRDLPSDLKQKLLDKGIRYTRTHRRVGAKYTYDVSEMLGWPQLFGTDSKEEVERICAKEGIPYEWQGEDQDVFVSTTQSDAFQLHPVTGEHVWFNHTQVFHWTTFAAELWFAFVRTWEIRLFLHCLFIGLYSILRYVVLGHKMSLNATFGDGEPISVQEMTQIRNAIHQNMVFSRWEKGDLLLIDNFSTSHGRQPTYDKGRKIAVAWADPIRKANAVTSLEPISASNPQEKTPESTLTSRDSAALQEKIALKTLESDLVKHVNASIGDGTEPADNLQLLFRRQHHRSKSALL